MLHSMHCSRITLCRACSSRNNANQCKHYANLTLQFMNVLWLQQPNCSLNSNHCFRKEVYFGLLCFSLLASPAFPVMQEHVAIFPGFHMTWLWHYVKLYLFDKLHHGHVFFWSDLEYMFAFLRGVRWEAQYPSMVSICSSVSAGKQILTKMLIYPFHHSFNGILDYTALMVLLMYWAV